MRWLTNGQTRKEDEYLHALMGGHEGKRAVIIRDPHPGKCTVNELIEQGMQGYYEAKPCQCSVCKQRRGNEYYKPLEDWRKMNEVIISRKEEERRAAIREAHTHPPITRRIVLDMGVDDETSMELCAFIGRVLAMAEYSNMLGYAMTIERREEPETLLGSLSDGPEPETHARQVYYDLIIDVDVSTTIEVTLTDLMSAIHRTAQNTKLIGKGLNIINMEA